MSPYEINMLLHYYTSPAPYHGGGTNELIHETNQRFIEQDLLEDNLSASNADYQITPLGKAMCKGLTMLPIPTPKAKVVWYFDMDSIEEDSA